MNMILATSLWARLTGLLNAKRCANGEALLLAPCRSIHSFGMRDKLDIAFIAEDARVLAAERNLAKGQLRSHPKAVAVLERRSAPQSYWPRAGEHICFDSSARRR